MTDAGAEETRAVELVRDRDRPSAFTVRFDGTDQSYVDLDDPLRLEFDYVQRMADVVDTVRPPGDPVRCVHVGGAGMSLARYVHATRPRSGQVVLEPDERVTAFVREHLPLPRRSGIKVRPVAGREGLEAMRDDFADVVVVDAFADARVPADLVTRECFATAARVVAPDGVLLLNLADRAPFDYTRRVVAAALTAFSTTVLSAEPATLKGRRYGNVLLVAARTPLPWQGLARKAQSSVFPYRLLPHDEVVQWLGGGVPFDDADSSRSPSPPSGPGAFR